MGLSTAKVLRYALVASLAALIGWLMVEPMNRAQERAKIDAIRGIMQDVYKDVENLARGGSAGSGPDDIRGPGDMFRSMREAGKMVEQLQKQQMERLRKALGNPYLNIAKVMMLVGMMLGIGLALADELGSFSPKRTGVRAALGAGAGAGGGFLAGIVGQFVFGILLPKGGFGAGFITLVFARSIAWSVLGLAIGTSVGAASGSKKLAFQGMAGGAIGGGVGGLFFDLLSKIGQSADVLQMTGYHYATAGRLFAGTLMGACIGAAVAMIQEYSKQAWITVLTGRNEGKDYILTKPITSIGRDELADVPLFGDKNVQKRHASVEENVGAYALNAFGPLAVNNQSVNQVRLHDGDLITIGRFILRFTTRAVSAFSYSIPVPAQQPYAQTQAYQPQSAAQAYTPGTPVVPKLRAVAGLLNGVVFDIPSCQVSIGRDPANTISLVQDTSVSRRHAEIIYENGQYLLRDVGSTNGIYVNGSRVTEVYVTPMDAIQIGATQFRLVFEPPGA